MIIGKIWRSIAAQFNKLANHIWKVDPIAQMQYEYDLAVEQLKTGKEGLAQYRALVERVARQVDEDQKHLQQLSARVKAFLSAGDRDSASKFALELQKAKASLQHNTEQLQMHEKAYDNNVRKIKHATSKVNDIKERIKKYDAEIKMSRAEAELSELANAYNFDMTTDLGQIESVLQDEIDTNRAKARVAADLSVEGMDVIEQEAVAEAALAEDALRQFEMDMGMITPQTANIEETGKDLGPAQTETN